MTVCIGVILEEGILLATDSRGTWELPNGEKRYKDNLQKLFALNPYTLVGIAGDVQLAIETLKCSDITKKTREEAYSTVDELKGALIATIKESYINICKKYNRKRPVEFMVGAVNPHQRKMINGKEFFEFCKRKKSGSFPGHFVESLKRSKNGYFPWGNAPDSTLFYLRLPENHLKECRYIGVLAAGSGSFIESDLNKQDRIDMFRYWTMNTDMGNLWVLLTDLGKEISQREVTVGGLLQVGVMSSRGVLFQQYEHNELDGSGGGFAMVIESGRWVQKNLKTGQTIKIMRPEEVINMSSLDETKFDYKGKKLDFEE